VNPPGPGCSLLVHAASMGQCVAVANAASVWFSVVWFTMNLAQPGEASCGTVRVAVEVVEDDGSWRVVVLPRPQAGWRGTSEGGEAHVSHSGGQCFLNATMENAIMETLCPSGSGWRALDAKESCTRCGGTGCPPGSTACCTSVVRHPAGLLSLRPLCPSREAISHSTDIVIMCAAAAAVVVGVVAVLSGGRQCRLCQCKVCVHECVHVFDFNGSCLSNYATQWTCHHGRKTMHIVHNTCTNAYVALV
jgi:hypothetical protein